MVQSKKIYLVYGNHGDAPIQLEDYLEYFIQIFKHSGYELNFAHEPVAGETNILIESFDENFFLKLLKVKENPATKVVIVVTEFITQGTFNQFSKIDESANAKFKLKILFYKMKNYMSINFSYLYRIFVAVYSTPWLKRLPDFYAKNFIYWQSRFEYFDTISQYANQIWCVSPHQLPEYQKNYGDKVRLLPIASYSDEATSAQKKDIDFFFSGTLTPRRARIISALKEKDFVVVTAPANLPSILREHYTKRSKVCLHLKQTSDWKYPSIMRYHKLLTSASVVVAEKSELTCYQENFIKMCTEEEFLSTCITEIDKGSFNERGQSAKDAYYKMSDTYRQDVQKLLSELN